METSRSASLFHRSQALIPGGVNSPVRSFRAVGGGPLFIQRGQGSRVWDADGNELIDYVQSWGPLILGHAHSEVVEALSEALAKGLTFGAPTEGELELAEIITNALPSVEMVRLVSSGTEAAMSAVRAARAYTGRDKIIKFAGCYHGHADGLLVEAGSGGATYSVPNSAGVPAAYAGETLVARFNDLASVERLLEAHQGGVAAVILEPVGGNVGVIPPADGFLEGLRTLTSREGALLIFDEVITGFRVAYGGAQTLYGVTPDLTCLGKIIGGGLPVGAYGGRREVMEVVAPLGSMYQAGTLSGNPLAVTAGIATLRALARPGVYEGLEALSSRLAGGIAAAAAETHLPLVVNRVGSMMSAFFNDGPVVDAESAMASDRVRYAAYFRRMLESGVYLAPSAFEAAFLSTAHTAVDVDYTIEAAARALEPHPAQ